MRFLEMRLTFFTFMLFSLVVKRWQKMKNVGEASFIPTAEWVRQLAEETAAFEVAKVVEPNERRGDRRQMEWDHVITLSAKPEKRRIDLFVQTRHQLSPQTVLGVFPKLKWVPPDGILLICAPFISPRVAELCREPSQRCATTRWPNF